MFSQAKTLWKTFVFLDKNVFFHANPKHFFEQIRFAKGRFGTPKWHDRLVVVFFCFSGFTGVDLIEPCFSRQKYPFYPWRNRVPRIWGGFANLHMIPRRSIFTEEQLYQSLKSVASAPLLSLSTVVGACSGSTCRLECSGKYSCRYSTFSCPADHTCTLSCTGARSCEKSAFKGPGISFIKVLKLVFEFRSCRKTRGHYELQRNYFTSNGFLRWFGRGNSIVLKTAVVKLYWSFNNL